MIKHIVHSNLKNLTLEQDEKLRERIILLTRLYWSDQIHKIGTDLDIEEIKNVENHWSLDYYKSVSLLAKKIDDSKLSEIIANYPTKYIDLGGFQGKHYSLDEKGNLKFESSWETVRKNVQSALKQWNEKAYSVLKALINKKGSSSYFELIDEIGKVLGKEYVPSFLLPRLSPLKLVFKTGSNKYPSWTIPTEIIPVVEEELQKFKIEPTKFTKTKPQSKDNDQQDSLLLIERHLDSLVEKIVDRKREINMIFESKFGSRFFIDNEKAIISIKKPCSTEDEFNNRIQGLVSIIDNIETDKIKQSLNIDNKIKDSVTIIEIYLKKHDQNVSEIISILRQIKKLRNKKFPTHFDDGEFIESMKYFGQNKFPPDWEELWENALAKTIECLLLIREKIQ